MRALDQNSREAVSLLARVQSEVAGRTKTVQEIEAKIPRSRRWRVTAFGHCIMSASVRLRQLHFPALYAEAA